MPVNDLLQQSFPILMPLIRLLTGLAAGLFIANILEAMRWTDFLASIAAPLSRFAHMGKAATSAFAMAFISSSAANGILSEAWAKGEISTTELITANIFNSFPACLLHAPTIYFLLWPAIGPSATIYVGITLLAAFLRMTAGALAGHFLLPRPGDCQNKREKKNAEPFRQRLATGFGKAVGRFRKRLPKLILITIPFYIIAWLCQSLGCFQAAEVWLAEHLGWLPALKPQAMAIVVLQMAAEMGATAGLAAAALTDGSLTGSDIVVALLAGNILGTPLRALRHQFPAYAGFFRPVMAGKLILSNQLARAASMILIAAAYILLHKH